MPAVGGAPWMSWQGMGDGRCEHSDWERCPEPATVAVCDDEGLPLNVCAADAAIYNVVDTG